MCWVYIIQNPKAMFYIGHTDNLMVLGGSYNRTDKISGKFSRKMVLGFWSGLNSTLIAQAQCAGSGKSNSGNLLG